MAWHWTSVEPRLNVEPRCGWHETAAMPETSEYEKSHVTLAAGVLPLVGVAVSGELTVYGGHTRTGLVLSELVTGNAHVLTLLALSVVVQPT